MLDLVPFLPRPRTATGPRRSLAKALAPVLLAALGGLLLPADNARALGTAGADTPAGQDQAATAGDAGLQVAALDREQQTDAASFLPAVKAVYQRPRGDDAGDPERVIFEFAEPVYHTARLDGDQLIIWFDQPRRFDLGELMDRPDSRLRTAEAVGDGPTRWVVLKLAPSSGFRSMVTDDHRIVISFQDQRPGPSPRRRAAVSRAPSGPAVATLAGSSRTGWAPRKRQTTLPQAALPEEVRPEAAIDAPAPRVAAVQGAGEPPDGGAALGLATMRRTARRGAPRALVPLARADGRAAGQAPPRLAAASNDAPTPATGAPGQFEIDEDALDRALERTLTLEGAVLLPFGSIEIEPGVSYSRQEFDAPTLINLFGFPAFGETEVRRNELAATLAARIGLPFDSQLELDAPYRYIDQSVMTTIGFDPIEEFDEQTAAFGDLGVGLAKTVLREGSWWPDAVARVRWDSATGKTAKEGIALGGGSHELTGTLSLVKSQDPLAFFGTLSYEKTFEDDGIDPGDRIGVSIGTVLAASPDTSLRASIKQSFIGDAEVEGNDIAGSDQMAATLSIGASSVLGRGVLLDAAAEIGLTDDAPDYAARLSLPIRFNLPRSFAFRDHAAAAPAEGGGETSKE